jgi:hypothetical protein
MGATESIPGNKKGRAAHERPHRRDRRELVTVAPNHEATFADVVVEWRVWAEHTKRLKPATVRNYDALLSAPGEGARGGGPRLARIMRAFGERRIAEISTAEVERFLRGLDREGLRWKHVRFAGRTLVVVAAMSAGVDSSTKSGKWRAVLLAR